MLMRASHATAAMLLLAAATCLAGDTAEGNLQPARLYSSGLTVADIHGQELALSQLAGKVTLIVNVASQCGYTDTNYKGLQETYEKYNSYGLEILAFPCNQFGAQEPGDAQQIISFVKQKYAASFPLMAKVEVNGAGQHPLFAWLKANGPPAPGKQKGTDVAWNFEKWLISRSGRVVKHYGSDLDGHELETDIYNELLKEEGKDEL